MPEQSETGVSREVGENVEESLFGDAAPGTTVEDGGKEEPAAGATGEEPRGSDAADEPADGEGSANEEQDGKDESGPVEEQTGADESGPDKNGTDAAEDLRIVVSVRAGISTIGVQRPSSDPHVESVADSEVPEIVEEVAAVIARAKAKWEEAPKYPAYVRPATSTGRRSRRGQGSGEDSTTEGEAAQAQQQALKLF